MCVCGLVSAGSKTEGESNDGGLVSDLWASLVKRVLCLGLQGPTQSALHHKKGDGKKEKGRDLQLFIVPCDAIHLVPKQPSTPLTHPPPPPLLAGLLNVTPI